MIIFVSGEGPTDIGCCNNGYSLCSGDAFSPGPMTCLVDKLACQVVEYSLLEVGAFEFVCERFLDESGRTRPRRSLVLPGAKSAKDTGYFFTNAQALAGIALERQEKEGRECPVGAILFRDADGTRSTRSGLWRDKINSIERGFAAAGFDRGVAMVPNPKSEAWLLCAIKSSAYQNCAALEELPGNDNSPDSAKDVLNNRLRELGKRYADVLEMIDNGTISPSRIDMPSFNHFRDRLVQVLKEMCGIP